MAHRKNGSRFVPRLIQRDGTKCHYCGCEMNFTDPAHPKYRTVDHIKPVFNHGKDRIGNVVLACRDCNVKKGSQSYKVFKNGTK